MLSDYAMYIENIRNSLIQCGVIFPQIDNIVTADYGSLFHIGEKINDIMYFYKIMYCSGNMEEMFLPLGKSYRGTVRMEAFTEFKEDILPALKELFGDEDEDDNFNFGVLLDIEGAEEEYEEPEEWVNEDVSGEDTIFEATDLFGDDDEDEDLEFDPVDVTEQFVSSGASLWGANSHDELEFTPNGTSLFSKKPVLLEEEKSWVSNGTELFSIQVDSNFNTANEDSVSYEGIWESEEGNIEVSDNDADVPYNDEDVWVEDTEDVFSDDEDFWNEEPEEVFEESEDVFSDDEDVWVEDSEEDYWEEPTSDSNDEDIWVEEYEDEAPEDFENDEDIWVSDSDVWEEEEIPAFQKVPVSSVASSNQPTTKPKPVNVPPRQVKPGVGERDIVDSVQDAASAALTSAKRFLARLTRPEE